jgi:two-component system response regulator TctD
MQTLLNARDRHNLQSFRLLFAEDDQAVAASMKAIFGHYFGDITHCVDGMGALSAARKERFDLLILDIFMPGMDGLEVARTLRECGQSVPILILTSFEEIEPLRRAASLRLLDYLIKPLEIEAFERVLKQLLDQTRLTRHDQITLNRHCYYDRTRQAIIRSDLPEHTATLSPNENTLLEMLIERQGRMVHLEEIDTRLYEGQMTAQALRNLIMRLREKLIDKESITTHRGIGFSWRR